MALPYDYYGDIPHDVRTQLDELYHPRGVEIWWNGRHGWLNNLRPCEEWKTVEGRERVRRVIECLIGGGW